MKKCIVCDTSLSRQELFKKRLSKYDVTLYFLSENEIKNQYQLEKVSSFILEEDKLVLVNEIENSKEEIKKISSLFQYRIIDKLVFNFNQKETRNQYNNISIVFGILVNLVLSFSKLLIGIFVGSIALISDSINNFADLLNHFIGYFGYKLSLIPPDKDHPYGHGRIEYLASLVIAVLIMISAVFLGIESYNQIVNPTKVVSSSWIQIIIIISIGLKYFLMRLNHYLSIKTTNVLFGVVAKDSLNDILLSIVLVINFISYFIFKLNIDGITGLLIAIVILLNGFEILKDMIDRLIGKKIDTGLYTMIKKEVLKSPFAFSVHDLILHSYGAENYYGSIHVEVESNRSILELHDEFDKIEKQIYRDYLVKLVIHLDPIEFSLAKRTQAYKLVNQLLSQYYFDYDLHDFRFIENELEFDLEIDFKDKDKEKIVYQLIFNAIKKLDEQYTLLINFEYK